MNKNKLSFSQYISNTKSIFDFSKKRSAILISSLLLTNIVFGSSTQSITMKLQKKGLHYVLEEIRKQANVDLIGDMTLLSKANTVSLNVKDKPIAELLEELSKDQPTQLNFQHNTIVVKPKKNSNNSKALNNSEDSYIKYNSNQEYILVGKIVDDKGKPLKGVTVKLLNSSKGVSLSNADGSFEIKITPQSEITISMIGYASQTIKVNGRKNLDVILVLEDNKIEEVVATGYANVRKENFTGAATVITRKEIEKFNTNNIFSLIQALDPAFKADERVQSGSNPNSVQQINIRGVSSVGEYAVNAPLVIIDGFEKDIETLYDLDVNRIENIVVLKDASSTSLYGSRGGNGVIVIETRMPKDGKFTITYDMKPSISIVDLSDYNLMNASEKLEYERLAGLFVSNSGDQAWDHVQQQFYDNLYASRLKNVLEGVDTYWLKQPVRNTFSVNNSLRMEGGSNDVRYSLEGNYYDMKGVMKESGRTKAGASFNLIYRIPNVITFRNIASYNYTKAYNSPYGYFQQYTELNPYERIFDEQGNYVIKFSELGQYYEFGNTIFNPLYNAQLGYKNENRSNLISNNLSLEWFVNKQFIVRGRAAISKDLSNTDIYLSPFNTAFSSVTDDNRKGMYELSDLNKSQYEGRLDIQYSNQFGKHQITGNVIGEVRSSDQSGNKHIVTGFIDDRFMTPQMALQYGANTLPVTKSQPIRSVGLIGSAYYTYDNKYNASATFRRDGSSIYGSENRFGSFWSLGLSYNLHSEEWFRNEIFNRFQLFGNVGTNSTENFSADMVNTSYKFVSGEYYYKQYAANYVGQGNTAVKWPEQKQTSIGANISLLENLLGLTASYYDRTTNGMISKTTVAPSFGFANRYYFQNLGKVSNKGFEINSNIRVYQDMTNDLGWFISFGAVRNKSKLLEISNELRELNESLLIKDDNGNVIKPSNYYEMGQSLTNISAVPSLGIDPASGREMYLNRNGNVTYTWSANDQRVVGDREPDLFGTVGTSFNYKGLSLQVIGNYSIGGDLYNETLLKKIENINPYFNADKRVLQDRWKQVGDEVGFKAIDDKTVTQSTSRFVQNENFLRISAINLNYNFSNELVRKFKLERLKLNFSMNDVFRFSTVRMERGVEYPYAREFNFGVMVQF